MIVSRKEEVFMETDIKASMTVQQTQHLFRRKPLLVEASPKGDHWEVGEAGRIIMVSNEDFTLLYEAVDVAPQAAVDAGLPDMEPGSRIDRAGRRLVRVHVVAGRGPIAYWRDGKSSGQDAGFGVVADMIDNPGASHRAGAFLEPFEGKPGTRVWVIL
jgi:hypothetical protein